MKYIILSLAFVVGSITGFVYMKTTNSLKTAEYPYRADYPTMVCWVDKAGLDAFLNWKKWHDEGKGACNYVVVDESRCVKK
jgi:hypothetical protein